MMFVRFRTALAAALLAAPLAASAQNVTGLSNWSIVLDPGHSQTENQGVYGYSEAEKTLGVGLELRRLLTTYTDIRGVYMTRTNSTDVVSLTQRADFANSSGGAYFHSIHSNAAGATATSGFVLWPQMPDLLEPASYPGGRAMARRMGPTVGRAMRIPLANGGDYGECAFYGVSTCGSGVKGSRNSVQRNTYMPSTLSEMGFHTNPTQNLRNMNADWKRMEARAFFWAILKNFNIPRPAGRFLTGIVSDVESGLAINGATIEYAGKSYTTDTYASLFNRYSTDPNELRNGYYYLEDVAAGANSLNVSAPGYLNSSQSVTAIDTFFTFVDVGLVSTAPLTVASTNVAGATAFRVIDPIEVTFSRPVAPATVQTGLTLTRTSDGSAVAGGFTWTNGYRRVVFTPTQTLAATTQYTLTIAGTAASPYGIALDGDANGTAGDAYVRTFTSGIADVTAPAIASVVPANNATNVARRPLINVTMNELVTPASRPTSLFSLANATTNATVPITVAINNVNGKTVVQAAPNTDLDPNTNYQFRMGAGMTDEVGNAVTFERRLAFTTNALQESGTTFEAFEDDFTSRWWSPSQSGSTVGTVADSTARLAVPLQEPRGGSTGQSMAIKYGWDTSNASSWLVRTCYQGCGSASANMDTSYTLQAAIFGDGSGTRLRFALDDNCSGGSCSGTEVGPWTDVTWLGWRLVEWDLGAVAPPENWIGTSNGQLNGNLRLESIQLTYNATTGVRFGQIAVDNIRAVKTTAVAGEDESALETNALALSAPTPNPTARTARLRYALPDTRPVRLAVFDVTGREVAVLVDETRAAGTHSAEWDATTAAPGMYLVRLVAGPEQRTATVVVQR